MMDHLRRFPMIVTTIVVLSTLVSICLVEVPLTIHTSTNLTCYDTRRGEKVPINGSIVLMMYGLWCMLFLVLMHEGIQQTYKHFKERNAELFARELHGRIILCCAHPVAIVFIFVGFSPCSEDVNRYMWFIIRMTCYGFLSIPLISWYFEDMGFCAERVPDAVLVET